MSKRYVIRKRENKIIYFETFITALLLSFILWKLFKYHWAFTIVTFGLFELGFIYAFFELRLFRYIITVLFSMVYGFIGFVVGALIDKNTFTASVVFSFIAYFISILLHKDHFDFLSIAKFIEYEKRNY
jgi:hypothetical protein